MQALAALRLTATQSGESGSSGQLATPHSRIEILQGNGSETGIDVCQLFDTETRTEFQLLLSNLSPPRITISIISSRAILVVVAPLLLHSCRRRLRC